MGLHPAMYCTPFLISSNVLFLTGTCFYRSNLFERPCVDISLDVICFQPTAFLGNVLFRKIIFSNVGDLIPKLLIFKIAIFSYCYVQLMYIRICVNM